mmetsp:Transcript_21067/g.43543  ORF Transcript_21067/g.43543 Transcript_21067/m.43543 type:complete len:174 (+) Transcript_21067:272-793(+)
MFVSRMSQATQPAYIPRANFNTDDLTTGIDTSTVHADAVNAIAIAAKGKASFSFANAAVPNPCAAAPMPKPLATASLIRNASNIVAPKLAPNNPVNTTIVTANDASAPRIEAIAIARGEVIFLDKRLSRTEVFAIPSNLTAAAVPYNPPNAETNVDTPTSGIFSRINFFLPYI